MKFQLNNQRVIVVFLSRNSSVGMSIIFSKWFLQLTHFVVVTNKNAEQFLSLRDIQIWNKFDM